MQRKHRKGFDIAAYIGHFIIGMVIALVTLPFVYAELGTSKGPQNDAMGLLVFGALAVSPLIFLFSSILNVLVGAFSLLCVWKGSNVARLFVLVWYVSAGLALSWTYLSEGFSKFVTPLGLVLLLGTPILFLLNKPRTNEGAP